MSIEKCLARWISGCVFGILILSFTPMPGYALSYQVSTGADYFDPNYHNIENIIDNSATASVITYADTSDIVFASSNLATGGLRVSAVSNQGSGRAGLMEELELSIPGLDAGALATIDIWLIIDGSYSAPSGQAAFAFYALSGIGSVINTELLQLGATYDTNKPTGSFHTVAPDIFRTNNTVGEWVSAGPRIFIGQIDIAGSDPTLRLDLDLTGVSGPADFSNTASIWLDLPAGTTIQSASGVFLSQADPPYCQGDSEPDEDVDGVDLAIFLAESQSNSIADVAKDFGRINCLEQF